MKGLSSAIETRRRLLWRVNGQIHVRLAVAQVAGSQRTEEHDRAEVGIRLKEALREPLGFRETGRSPLTAHVFEMSRSPALSRFEPFGDASKESLSFLVHSRGT
ncbi:MAG: hypothetical protein OXQ31_08650 [Spirochaetaceae bacterium]|nr:hypothetical protein [Spirochaetaceae bacterium]